MVRDAPLWSAPRHEAERYLLNRGMFGGLAPSEASSGFFNRLERNALGWAVGAAAGASCGGG